MRSLLESLTRATAILILLLSVGFVLSGCDRYEHKNPYDPEYEGDFWNPVYANLVIDSAAIVERLHDISSRYFHLPIYVKNVGTSAATGVKVSIFEVDSIATVIYDKVVVLGEILPGETVSTEWPDHFQFKFAKHVKTPVDLKFLIVLNVPSGASWQDTLEITVEAANLRLAGITVEEWGSYTDHRSFRMLPIVENAGSGWAIGVNMYIQEENEFTILYFPTTFELGDIPPGDTVAASGSYDYFRFLVPDSVSHSFNASFILTMTVADSTSWVDTAEVLVPI